MIVCIEGNIASGKSSALTGLHALGHAIRPEPIGEWGDMLDLYYADPATWSLAFNLKVLHSFHGYPSVPGNLLVERSPGACRHVFGQLAYNDNHLSASAWDVFKEYHDILGWEPVAYVYINTPVDVCYQRLQQRGRPCEVGITEDYLRRIEFQYTNFLKFSKVPVHWVDGMQSPEDIVRDIASYIWL